MGTRQYLFLIYLTMLIAFVVGCARMEVPIPVMHPAEINLQGRDQVKIDRVSGRGGREMEAHIREILGRSPTIKLVDATIQGPIIGYQPPTPAPGQKQSGGLIVVRGDVLEYDYDEHMSRTMTTCTRRVKRNNKYVDEQYGCPHYTRTGRVRVRAAFQVIDGETGQVIRPKSVACEDREQTQATDSTPSYIDGEDMLIKCAQKAAFDFTKTISPWVEDVKAGFYKDDALPMLEKGIELARLGQWDQAISLFKQGVAAAAADPTIKPKAAARAHWDLGLAYEYTGRFDEAYFEIRKAYELTSEPEYGQELRNVNKMRHEKEELDKQLRRQQ